jgi:hypothetical protein
MAGSKRRVDRLLIGTLRDTSYWFLGVPGAELVKKSGTSYYDRMMAPVSARWCRNFDLGLLEQMGAGWFLPLVERMAEGEVLSLETVLQARDAAGIDDDPEIDGFEWSFE